MIGTIKQVDLSKYHLLFISIMFGLVSYYLYSHLGIKSVNDSHRYLSYAENIKIAFYAEKHNFWYLGYAVFIFLVQQVQHSELALIIAQNILSWIAIICLYQTTLLIFKSKKGALITALLYILSIEILAWNSYILCESIYCSATCISFFVLARIYRGKTNIGGYVLATLIVCFTVLTKPTGIALLGAISIVLFVKINNTISNKALRYSLIAGCVSALILLINKMLTTYLVMENYQIGEIVYAISTIPQKPTYRWLMISVPEELYLPSSETAPLLRILSFILHHPFYWSQLFISKVFYFLVHIRPYWSLQHNLFTLIILLPLYFYSFRGTMKLGLRNEISLFFIVYFTIHTLSVGITSVDWDGRFLMPVLPAIFMVASNELVKDFEKHIVPLFSKRKESRK